MVLTLLVFILIIGFVVFVHELGHFIAAKKGGVKVEEFAFGFKPKIWGVKKGETLYAINAVPLGGYVKMLGEDEKIKDPRSYSERPKWIRLIILVAGVFMNFVTCWLIFAVLYGIGFDPIFLPGMGNDKLVGTKEPVRIEEVAKDSPAAQAGIKSGDILIKVGDLEAKTTLDTTLKIYENLDKPLNLQVQRGSENVNVSAIPRSKPPEGQGALGISLTGGVINAKWYTAPWVALKQTGRMAKMSLQAFGGFVKQLFVKREVSNNVTGLVGMGVATDIVRKLGFTYVLQLVGLICASLAVINLVPIVPMDGGQVLVLGIEAATKKKLSDNQIQWMSLVGLGFIILLFIVVTFHDIIMFGVIDKIKGLF